MKKKNIILLSAIILFIILIAILLINNINNPQEGKLSKITYSEIKEKIDNKEDFILIVSQTTCSHCASYKPKVETVVKKYGIEVYYIDYDQETKENQKKILDELNLSGATPMTLFFIKGKEKSIFNRIEGDTSQQNITKTFKKMGFIK